MVIDEDFTDFSFKVNDFKAELALLVKDDDLSLSIRKNFVHLTAISSGSVNVEGFVSASS